MTNALGHNLVDFQPAQGRHNIRLPHFASKVSYSAAPQTFAKCPHGVACPYPKYAPLAGALARTIVCCGASIVAHFARKVSYSAAPQTFAMPYKLSIRGRR